jgi:DNA-binding transcriptional ArsR family regulator
MHVSIISPFLFVSDYRITEQECFDYCRTVKEGPDIAHIAAFIGDPACANMLIALMRRKALTVSELASEAGVTNHTASSHLSKLDYGGLLRPRKQGRHKYFSLFNNDVAHVLESLMGLAICATAQVQRMLRCAKRGCVTIIWLVIWAHCFLIV